LKTDSRVCVLESTAVSGVVRFK